jgi:outer membrane murein-binding lipoprotein Lpp
MLLPALVVFALVGVVAIASTGSTSSGTGRVRPPSATLLDTILSLGLVGVLAGAALLAYGLTQRKAIRGELASRRYPRTSLLAFLVFVSLFTLVSYWRLRDWEVKVVEDNQAESAFPGPLPVPGQPGAEATVSYTPEFAWLPVIVVVGLAAAAIVAYVVAERRSDRARRGDEALAEQLAEILDDTLDDLRAETDPRRAVIAAYARLERVLAAHGTPRRPAETPEEYLARVLRDLEIDADAIRRLTDLFSRAKFSQHAVDIGMKEEAIEALEHVRDELREAAAAREEARRAKLHATEAST